MKKLGLLLAVGVLALLGACGQKDSGKRVLAVSVEPQRELLQAIAGDEYEVVTILPPSGDVESFEPSVQTMTSLQKAEAWFKVGNVGFEQALEPKLRENFPNLAVYASAKSVKPVEGTHGHDEDPHVWSSIANARLMAASMTAELKRLDPQKAAVYDKNFALLDSSLAVDDSAIRALLADAPQRSFAIWHPSLSYFARDYDLNQIALETDGKETTPRQLRDRLDSLKNTGVKTIFYERAHGSSQAETAAKQLGLRVVEISLNDSNWRKSLRAAAEELAK